MRVFKIPIEFNFFRFFHLGAKQIFTFHMKQLIFLLVNKIQICFLHPTFLNAMFDVCEK